MSTPTPSPSPGVLQPWSASLVLPVAIVFLALAALAWLCYQRLARRRVRRRGSLPIEIEVFGDEVGANADAVPPVLMEEHKRLEADFVQYIAEDLSELQIARPPGGGEVSSPGTSTHTAPETMQGVLARHIHLSHRQKPAHIIRLRLIRSESNSFALSLQVVEKPQNTVEGSCTFVSDSWQDVIAEAGCYCLQEIRRCPTNFRHSLRWEQWSGDRQGYRHYRDALRWSGGAPWTHTPGRAPALFTQNGQRNEQVSFAEFQSAQEAEPRNLGIRLLHAQTLEAHNKNEDAIELYKKCLAIWHESIETRYRLLASYINSGAMSEERKEEARKLAKDLKNRLRVWKILSLWLQTWKAGRSSLGERRYWMSWLQHGGNGYRWGKSKRVLFRRAVLVMEESLRLLDDQSQCRMASMAEFMTKMKRAGWMANYNAACFYSYLIQNDETHSDDCADNALTHLANVIRNPLSEPNRFWAEVDPSLNPLKTHPKGEEWMKIYLGSGQKP